MTKAIVSLSGGMDSATVLAAALHAGRRVEAVGFSYGSKHNPWENRAAGLLAGHYGAPFTLVDLTGLMREFKSDLLAAGGPVPEGHYEEETMRATVVPARNAIFLAALAGLAHSRGCGEVWVGVHAGDHYIYPDCRPAFVRAMEAALGLALDAPFTVAAPFLQDTKVGILQAGFKLGVPYAMTRTCYTADELACGKCGSCRERLAAFQELGAADPLPYAFRHPTPAAREVRA